MFSDRSSNPFDGVEKLNAQEDVRHPRRALTAKEFSQLVQSARSSHVSIQCYDGEMRARIYIMSYLTGLRRKELSSLTSASFSLDASQPTLTVEAAHSKHRRKDTLPLHPELVSMLQQWLVGLEQDEPLFPKLSKRRTYKMVKLDLERAGIAYETPEGIADFHAAGRHTHITELLRNGASLVEARELARHSDIKMTMKYTHIGVQDQARALQNIPTAGLSLSNDGSKKSRSGSKHGAPESWEYPGSKSRDISGQNVSSSGNEQSSQPKTKPLPVTGVIAKKRRLSSVVKSGGGGNRMSLPAVVTLLRTNKLRIRQIRWQEIGRKLRALYGSICHLLTHYSVALSMSGMTFRSTPRRQLSTFVAFDCQAYSV